MQVVYLILLSLFLIAASPITTVELCTTKVLGVKLPIKHNNGFKVYISDTTSGPFILLKDCGIPPITKYKPYRLCVTELEIVEGAVLPLLLIVEY